MRSKYCIIVNVIYAQIVFVSSQRRKKANEARLNFAQLGKYATKERAFMGR